MIPYILHVTVIIAVCFLFYKIFLQKETFYRLNRWTLMTCLAVAFALPLLPAPRQWNWRDNYENGLSGLFGTTAPAKTAVPLQRALPAAIQPSLSLRSTASRLQPSFHKQRTSSSHRKKTSSAPEIPVTFSSPDQDVRCL